MIVFQVYKNECTKINYKYILRAKHERFQTFFIIDMKLYGDVWFPVIINDRNERYKRY